MTLPARRPTTQRSVRRGPTMRGRSYRPPIGRPVSMAQPNNSSDDDEEFMALNRQDTDDRTVNSSDGDLEMQQIDFKDDYKQDDNKNTSHKSLTERPVYHHGDETFGDVISHPIQEFNAHRQRRETYRAELHDWEERMKKNAAASGSGGLSSSVSPPEEEEPFLIVVHFRQLRGNQSFVLDHDKAEEFARKLRLTTQERIQFNGVHDTDGLTAFLYKTKREFSIKIHHHKSELLHQHDHHHSMHDLAHLEHNPENQIIEFNDNVYIEFKPHRQIHHEHLPPEATRRPFFQHPEPDLSADIGQEKAASWLELFYDLFYVATLSEFTHTHHIKDWTSLGTYASWFVITWWAWFASSLYTARFDTDDVVHHIWRLIEMCAVIAMAGSADHFLNSKEYVLGYIVLKAVLVVEYSIVFIVALMARSKSRLPLAFYVGANLVSITLWAASLAIIEQGTHRILWYLGILAEVLVNVISRRDKTLSWAASHLAERLGLLTLIVLGENLMGLINLVAVSGTYYLIMIPNFMAVVIIFGFFFMYFEDFNKEVFLHNKHHQMWVYLHFPLHLFQVAFGISLIDTLKVYRAQGIASGLLPAPEPETTAGESGSAEASGSAAEPSGSGAESASATESGQPAAETTTAEAAHKLARRAIESVQLIDDSGYNPMASEEPVVLWPMHAKSATAWSLNGSAGYLTLCQYVLSSAAFTALQALSGNPWALLGDGNEQQQIEDSTHHHHHHHLAKRAGSSEEVLNLDLSDAEKVFIYKTFLIFGGLMLILNSLIKMLNTKISDIYGKIIIGSRILNAIVLWSMCALPFASLDAIVLVSVMMGSMILQAIVDLLD